MASTLVLTIVILLLLVGPPTAFSATTQTGSALFRYGAFATANGCGSITLTGAITDSFDSSAGTYATTKQNAFGNLGSNGNINMAGGAIVNGTASSPRKGTGACSNQSPTGLTTSGGASATGGLVVLTGPLSYAIPPAPNPLPPTVGQSISGGCGTIAGCTALNDRNVALAAGSYGNLAISGGTSVHLSRGTYRVNSVALSGNSAIVIDSTPVFLNVSGQGLTTTSVVNFTGGAIVNSSGVPGGFQIVYGGALSILLSGGSSSYAVVYAPNAPISLSGGGGWYGAAIGSTITSSIAIHYDRALANAPLSITASPDRAPNAAGWNNTNVTVSFSCSGMLVTSCASPVPVTTEGAKQTVSGSASDIGGNVVTVSLSLDIDKTPPSVLTSRAPLANAKGWNNINVTVTFNGTDSLSGLAACSSPVELTNEGANQSTSGTCTDKAGNTSPSSTVTGISIDKTSPVVAITSPANGATVSSPLAVIGTVTDSLSGTSAVTCNGTAASVNGTSFSCSVPLVSGSNTVNAAATDVAGNTATASATVLNSSIGSITMITPNATQQGQVFTVIVAGANSHFAQGSTRVDFGSGTGADNVTVTGPLSLTARVTVNPSAIVGTRKLTVTTGTEVLVLDSALSVLEGPKISASADRAPNAAGWYNADVTVTFTCSDSVIGIRTCPPATVVSTEGNHQVVSGTAVNNSGTQVTTSLTLSIDKTPPLVTFTAPANGSILLIPTVNVAANVTDTLSGISTTACNGSATTASEGSIGCSAALVAGTNSIAATATDQAGNSRTTNLSVTYSRAPKVKITSPVPLSYLSLSPTTVTGTVDDPAAVVMVNSVSAPVSNGQFSVTVPLAEGPTIIAASATAAGGAVGTDSVEVTLDTTPPHVHITSPPDHFVTTETTVSVAGIVNDIVVGTVNDQQAQVSVNSLPAQVGNRTFLTSNVPLAVGDNLIRAVARDRVGNTVAEEITVTRQTATSAGIRVISGNNQVGVIGAVLASSLVVSLTDGSGNPSPNKKVIFKVTQDDGLVQVDAGTPAPSVIALTDAQGRATVNWKLGLRAGAGSNSVEAYAVGFDGTAMFSATGIQGAAAKIVVDTGNDQIGAAGQPLPRPLIAVVVDAGNNRLAGIPVTFTVKEGGGNFAGQPSFTINTDSDGRAAATLTLGLQEGNANNVVLAGFTSNPGPPAGFTASSRVAGDPLKTKVTGVVLDNSNVPIPGVTIRAALTSQINTNKSIIASLPSVQTDAQGQFVLNQAPVGYIKLLIDGLTATRPGTYPMLEYDFVTVAGQDNNVGQPIYLLPLNEQNKLCVTASTGGGTLTVAEAPGFSLTFSPGQVTFPGGSKEGCISVTIVHGDKVPMVPGFGQQPRFIVTIQPPGAAFNPPATITMPNVDGLRPREVTEMYSFDHDINSFVAIGTGVVSDDGQVIRSSPGVGVLKAGWHCGGNPTATGSAANCAQCKMCDGVSCVPNPAGGTCDDGKFCTDGDFCSNGTCASGTPKPDIPGPTLTATLNVDSALNPLRGFLSTVFKGNEPTVVFTVSGNYQEIEQCCETTRGMVTSKTGSVTLGGGFTTPDIPIPGAGVTLPFGISAGLFVTATFGLTGGVSGTLDACTNTGSGTLTGGIGLSGTIKAQLTLPAGILGASVGGTIGASCNFSAPIQRPPIPVHGTCGHDGIIVSATADFGGGIFQTSANWPVIAPATLADIDFTISSPF